MSWIPLKVGMRIARVAQPGCQGQDPRVKYRTSVRTANANPSSAKATPRWIAAWSG